MSEESLKQKSVKGTIWSLADNLANTGITFLVGIVLARLLSPDEYGLIGIITLFITVFTGIIDSGFSNALIRKKDATEKDYNTVFIANLIISIALFAVLYLCSSLIASFFGRPELTNLTRAMSVILIINALSIVQNAVLTKRIDFKTKTKASFISSILSGAIGIGMALYGFGVWALVGQQISRQAINTICLWLFNRWWPSFRFYWDSFRELWNYGYKVLLTGLIDNIWREIYQVVIGKCYSAEILGQYTRARQFTTIFSSNLSSVIQRVSFPVLSSVQDNPKRLLAGYRRIIKVSMFVSFTLTLGMAASAKSMILVLVGEKWLPCVPLLQIISLNMMLYPLHSLNLNMLQVTGRSDLLLKLEIIKKCITIIPILFGIFGNIYWMLGVGFITGGCFDYYLNSYYSGKLINYSSFQQLRDIFPSFIIAITMAIVVFLFSLIPISPFFLFPIQILIGAIYVIIISEKINLEEYNEIKSILKSYLKK